MPNISNFAKEYFVIQFNGALPVTLEVLEKIGFNRYQLKVGHKQMGTRSQSPLKVGHRYWANFSQTREGMLAINTLKEKPPLLQKEMSFLDLPSWKSIDDFAKNDIKFFKNWILNSLQTTEIKSEFLMLTSMLLALNEGIIHLPFKINKRPFLLQWKINEEGLNENLIDFYFAFDTIGAIKGKINNEINMEVLYQKSANLFIDKTFEEKPLHVSISNQMLLPLWKGDDGLLDVKG